MQAKAAAICPGINSTLGTTQMKTENTEMFVTSYDDQGFKTYEEAEQACIDLLQIHEKTNVTYEIFFVYGEYLPYWETINKS